MPVKLKEIGAVVEKRVVEAIGSGELTREIMSRERGFNQAIDQSGEISIGFNRERLASILYNRKIKNYPVPNDEDILEVTAESYREAEAIIANEASILEVVK